MTINCKISEVRQTEKRSSDNFYALTELMSDAKKRWDEQRDSQIELYFALKQGDINKVKEVAERHHHPLFKTFLSSL